MDYFYAQVEEKENPELADKPVAIGGSDQKRGVLSTCNYIARSYGIHSAMPTAIAIRKCPELIVLPPSMAKYKQVSQQIRDVFYSVTSLVEPLSLDEAYLDVTEVKAHSNSATLIAKSIKADILLKTGLTGSAGVAPNKLLAKIASDINKPNGLYVINPSDIKAFIHDLSVKKLFGVGKVTQQKLNKLGIEYCYQLQSLSQEELINYFGKFGGSLYSYCRGVDNRPVNPERIRRSISVENTYIDDLKTYEECLAKLPELYSRLMIRITGGFSNSVSGIFVKITDSKFNKHRVERQTHRYNIDGFKFLLQDIYNKQQYPIRLLGLGVRLNDLPTLQLELDLDI